VTNEAWIDKYRPQKIAELIGNHTSISKISDWLQNWPRSITRNRRALIVFGPPGVGKTTSVYVIAQELGYEITEINASDKRTKKILNQLLKNATTSGSLFSKRGRVVLIDELSGLSGQADRGAASAIKKYIELTHVPIILVTQDPTERKISPLRRLCQSIEFIPLAAEDIIPLLSRICKKERISFDEKALGEITKYSRGDIRAAINDLQSVVRRGGNITLEAVQRTLKWRDQSIEINEALSQIFYAETWKQAIEVMNRTNANPDQLIKWISSNLPQVFKDTSQLSEAYFWLARASTFSRRIRKSQNWKLLPYYLQLMCITSSITGGSPSKHKPKFKYPEWINQMWRSKSIRQKQQTIGEALAPHVHTSSRSAFHEYFPVLKALLKNKTTRNQVLEDLELSSELEQFILSND
jgi:replication factor C large subunit